MFRALPKSEATLSNDITHYETLKALDREEQWAVKYIYDRLSIIDSKMSALLRVNGIIIGFVTVAVFKIAERPDIVARPIFFLSVCFVIFMLLAFAEIMGARIFYLAFDRVTSDHCFEQYRNTSMQITIKRERQYRSALWSSVAGILLFIVVFMIVTGAQIWSLAQPPASP